MRIALNLKNTPYEYRAVHLLKNGGEQHQESYQKLNPAKEVPTLVHNKNVISQSMAILEYLDVILPNEIKLFSSDPFTAAKVRQVCETINCLQPLQNLRTLQYLTGPMQLSEEKKLTWTQHWINLGLTALEGLLAANNTQFAFGEHPNAADCFLAPQFFASRRFQIQIENYPRLFSLEKAYGQHPAFIKAHPKQQPDFQE